MSESVLAQGTWAEDGDSDVDAKPLPPSPEVGPCKTFNSPTAPGTEHQLSQEGGFQDFPSNDNHIMRSRSDQSGYYLSHGRGNQYHHSSMQLRQANHGGGGGGNLRGGREAAVPEHPPFKALIANLPPDIDTRVLRDDLFHGKRLLDVHIPNPRRGSSAGMHEGRNAYVEFVDQACLREALQMDGRSIYGRNIRVSVAQLRLGEHRQQPHRSERQHFARRDNVQRRDLHQSSEGGERDQKFHLEKSSSMPIPSATKNAASSTSVGRKKLVLQPRSKPIEDTPDSMAKITSKMSSIFGDGKPRDERVHQAENRHSEERQLKPVQNQTKSPFLKLQQPAVRPIQIQSRKKPVTCPENKKDEKARSSNDKKSLRERPISKGGPGKSSPESSVEAR